MKYQYSYSMAARTRLYASSGITSLARAAFVIVVAIWCIVQASWMLLSSSGVVYFLSTEFELPNRILQSSDSTSRIQYSDSRSIRSIIPLQVTLKVEDSPKKTYYSYSTDECLLQDAFEAARRVTPSTANSKKPKIAFLFLVRGEIPFEPLWRRFFAGHEQRYSLYVHTAPNFTFPRSSFFFGKQIPSQSVERLSRSLADAVRRLMAMALVDVENYNTWFVNVCESTIPLRRFDDTYRYLMRSRHSFVQSFQPVPKYLGAVPYFNQNELRKGEVWMALRRRHAVTLVADRITYAIFWKQCRKLCSFDERYFQTLLHLRDPGGIANRTIMFVDWSGQKVSSPRTFDAQNTNASLLHKIATLTEDSIYGQHYNNAFQKFGIVHCAHNGVPGAPCFLFARKFHPSSLDVVMEWFSNFQESRRR